MMTAADLARKTTTKNPHGLAFDILFDEALEVLEKTEAASPCNKCTAKDTCAFYEKDADECVYDILAKAAKIK